MNQRYTFSFLMLTMIAGLLNAQIINVPADKTTIQAAIDSASTSDTVLVAEGTFYENINFKGKAITVASQFLIDGDTSHISNTVIDGSQPVNPDTASVVAMYSGEDTTSVLCGFTLRGGKGTKTTRDGYDALGGGGVIINNSGGAILNNIIEEIHLVQQEADIWTVGCGIYGYVNHNHTLIIRNNIIRNNTAKGPGAGGNGIFIAGGRIHIEGNSITNNSCQSDYYVALGGGIFYITGIAEGIIPEVTINNNIISHNILSSNTNNQDPISMGGGLYLGHVDKEVDLQIYNNLICNNSVDGRGGGFTVNDATSVVIFNNTIVNNTAEEGGNCLHLYFDTDLLFFNNIVWNDNDNGKDEIYLRPGENNILNAVFNNIISGWEGTGNINVDPGFVKDTFLLSEGSPCIGHGVDSIEIHDTWYYSASTDLSGNERPNPIDKLVDMGAFESPYEGFVHIPDTLFLADLIEEGVDTDEDGQISYAEAEAVTKLRLAVNHVACGGPCCGIRHYNNLIGIESFLNLDSLSIECTTVDSAVFNNTELKHLSCFMGISYIEISSCPALEYLRLNNIENKSLDLSGNKALKYLRMWKGAIRQLNISANSALEKITLSDMQDLHEICVWDSFSTDIVNMEIDTTGSPNAYFTTECTTGLSEYEQKKLNIYPNPTNNLLSIETDNSESLTIEIHSLNGKLFYRTKGEGPSFQIDLSSFQKGLYFITVSSRDYVRTEKIIKL
ncbi:T9SS type A sorting domain-containing protein [Bacteroidota bacterium]